MQKRTKRLLIILTIFFVCLFGLYQLAGILAPGSYPYAEIYELNVPEENVIAAINQFKLENSEFVVPEITIDNKPAGNISDGQGTNDNSYWYSVYFYYSKENKIVKTWTRPEGKTKTSFAFVGLNDGLDLGNWKFINNDFGFSDNSRIKKQFEERILSQIEIKLKNMQ